MERSSKREKLELESPKSRRVRLGRLFTSISSDRSLAPQPVERETFAVHQSDALARAIAFLPVLASSNVDLLARAALDPGADDMERTDGQHTVIAMDLGLGVFDAAGLKGDLGPIVERRKKRKRTRMEDGLRKGNDGELEDEMVNGDEEEAGSKNESEDTEDRHTDSEDATPSDSSSDTTSEESDGTTGEDNHEEDDGDGGSDHTDGESR